MRRQVGREGLDRGQYADDYFSAGAFNGSGVWGDIRPVPYFPDRCPSSAGAVVAEDVIYFVFCSFMSFFLTMTVNFGQVRFFILLGELLGFLLYYLTLGTLVMKCAQRLIACIRWIFRALWKLLLRPVVLLIRWIGRKVGRLFGETGKKREKSCAKTQKTLANKANIIV